MNDQQIDAAVRECVRLVPMRDRKEKILEQAFSALVRRVRDAEQERCAVLCDKEAAGWKIALDANCAGAAQDCAAAIRAPRTEEKR